MDGVTGDFDLIPLKPVKRVAEGGDLAWPNPLVFQQGSLEQVEFMSLSNEDLVTDLIV